MAHVGMLQAQAMGQSRLRPIFAQSIASLDLQTKQQPVSAIGASSLSPCLDCKLTAQQTLASASCLYSAHPVVQVHQYKQAVFITPSAHNRHSDICYSLTTVRMVTWVMMQPRQISKCLLGRIMPVQAV